jgi:hypothetical protein
MALSQLHKKQAPPGRRALQKGMTAAREWAIRRPRCRKRDRRQPGVTAPPQGRSRGWSPEAVARNRRKAVAAPFPGSFFQRFFPKCCVENSHEIVPEPGRRLPAVEAARASVVGLT